MSMTDHNVSASSISTVYGNPERDRAETGEVTHEICRLDEMTDRLFKAVAQVEDRLRPLASQREDAAVAGDGPRPMLCEVAERWRSRTPRSR